MKVSNLEPLVEKTFVWMSKEAFSKMLGKMTIEANKQRSQVILRYMHCSVESELCFA